MTEKSDLIKRIESLDQTVSHDIIQQLKVRIFLMPLLFYWRTSLNIIQIQKDLDQQNVTNLVATNSEMAAAIEVAQLNLKVITIKLQKIHSV